MELEAQRFPSLEARLPFLEGGNLSEALYFCEKETFVARSFFERKCIELHAGWKGDQGLGQAA